MQKTHSIKEKRPLATLITLILMLALSFLFGGTTNAAEFTSAYFGSMDQQVITTVGSTIQQMVTIYTPNLVPIYGYEAILSYPAEFYELDVAATEANINNTSRGGGVKVSDVDIENGTAKVYVERITFGTPLTNGTGYNPYTSLALMFNAIKQTNGAQVITFTSLSLYTEDVDDDIIADPAGFTPQIISTPAVGEINVAPITQEVQTGAKGIEITATIQSPGTDVFGFMTCVDYPGYYITLNREQFAIDNPDLIIESKDVSTSVFSTSSEWIYIDSNGVTPVLKAGAPYEIKLTFDINLDAAGTRRVSFGTGDNNVGTLLFVDEDVRVSDFKGLPYPANVDTVISAIDAGKIIMGKGLGDSSIVTRQPNKGAVEYAPHSDTETNQPVLFKATITAPADNDVYGFVVSPAWNGPYLTFDADRFNELNGNNGVTVYSMIDDSVDIINPTATSSTGNNMTQVKVAAACRSTPLIAAGESFDIYIPFNPVLTSAGTRKVDFSLWYSALFIENDIILDKYTTAEAANTAIQKLINDRKAVSITATAGFVTTTVTRTHPVLDGYYNITAADDILWLAELVNTGAVDPEGVNYSARISLPSGVSSLDLRGIVFPDGSAFEGESFKGIGTKEHPYFGTFYGNSYRVSIVIERTVTADEEAAGGLFNFIGAGAAVEYVDVSGSLDISAATDGASIGGIIGSAVGASVSSPVNNISIINTASGSLNLGGIIGTATNMNTFNGGTNNGTITLSGIDAGTSNIGGIVGVLTNATSLTLGTNNADITVSGSEESIIYLGGVAGSVRLTDSNASRSISTSVNSGAISGGTVTGGVVGRIVGGSVNNTTNNSGAVSSNGIAVGGIYGTADSTRMVNIFNTNTASVSGSAQYVGGLIGRVYGDAYINSSWNEATVATTGVCGAAGGLIGEVATSGLNATFNYNLGIVSCGEGFDEGGIVGRSTGIVTAADNFYLRTTATGDAISAIDVAAISLTKLGTRYSYLPPEPETGDGTRENPYVLTTVEDLIWFAKTINTNLNGADKNKISAVLFCDIDMSNVSEELFTQIGSNTASAAYGGVFDGAGYTITVDTNVSLFNSINGAIIKNLTVYGVINTPSGAAGIVSSATSSLIENCVNKANITTASSGAGIVLRLVESTVKNCKNYGDITGTVNSNIGGIVVSMGGLLTPDSTDAQCIITDCVNYGKLTGGWQMGGIVSYIGGARDVWEQHKVSNCSNLGNIVSNTVAVDSVIQHIVAGGIVGIISDGDTIISNCSNAGNITSAGNHIGGILGKMTDGVTRISILNSSNTGALTSTYDGPHIDTDRSPSIMSIGGIAGSFSYSVSIVIGTSIMSDNINTGEINPGKIVHAGALFGNSNSHKPEEQLAGTGNKSTVAVPGDKNSSYIEIVDPEKYQSDEFGRVTEKPVKPVDDDGRSQNNEIPYFSDDRNDEVPVLTTASDEPPDSIMPDTQALTEQPLIVADTIEIPMTQEPYLPGNPSESTDSAQTMTVNQLNTAPIRPADGETITEIIPEITVSADNADASNLTEIIDEDTPESEPAPSAQPEPVLDSESLPEVIRETVKNNVVTTVIIIVACVVVLAVGGTLIFKRKRSE